jgi:hypothetical protein
LADMEAAAMEAAAMAVAAMAVVPPAGLTDPSVHNPNDCGIGDLFSGAVWLFRFRATAVQNERLKLL